MHRVYGAGFKVQGLEFRASFGYRHAVLALPSRC